MKYCMCDEFPQVFGSQLLYDRGGVQSFSACNACQCIKGVLRNAHIPGPEKLVEFHKECKVCLGSKLLQPGVRVLGLLF